MRRVAIDDVVPATDGRERERRGLADALGTTDLALNHFRLGAGERISGLHAHGDQEEVFVVLEGTVTVETLGGEVEAEPHEVAVGAQEAVRFAPGEYQSARNDGASPATVLAIGAPTDSEDVRIPLACSDCGHEHVRPTLTEDGEPVLACPDCGAETTVECPDCGGADMLARLGPDGEAPVSACRECGHESETLSGGSDPRR